MSIPRETIEYVRERARIEEIIAMYVPSLKLKGRDFLGLCPFHKEKTPSFTVSPAKQFFHCFGCHEGGNVFSFIQKVEHLNFPESVKFVGRLVGVDVADGEEREQQGERELLLRISDFAARLFQKELSEPSGRAALDYITARGINAQSLERFALGYSPDSWDFLKGALSRKGVSSEKAAALGLLSAREKEDGSRHYYDRFRGRLMFPIHDASGKVCAFGGRVLGEGEPKYLNSPESELFHKRSTLYGLHQAIPAIRDAGRVIVVEGYLDVIACHQCGVANVVAPLGTALTEEQLRLLSRYCQEMVLLFDADNAGQNASLRSLDVCRQVNLTVRVASLPTGDPCDFILEKGARAFFAVVDTGLDPIEYRLNRAFSQPGGDRRKLMLRIFEILSDIEFDTERVPYIRKAAARLEVEAGVLQADFEQFRRGGARPAEHRPEVSEKTGERQKTFVDTVYKDLIILLCHHPELVRKAVLDFEAGHIPDPVLRSIFVKLGEEALETDDFTVDRVFDLFDEGSEKKFLEENLSHNYLVEDPDGAYTEIYLNMRLFELEQRMDSLVSRLARAESPVEAAECLTGIEVCRRDREKLSTYLYQRGSGALSGTEKGGVLHF